MNPERIVAFGVGAVATLLVGWAIIGGRATLSEHCGVDGAVVWSAVQAIAIILGGAIAFMQFRSYTEMERAKATIELLVDFRKNYITAYSTFDYGEPWRLLSQGTAHRNRAERTQKERQDSTRNFIEISNYFSTAENLLFRGIIDVDSFFENMGDVILRCYVVAKALSGCGQRMAGGQLIEANFAKLARAAQVWPRTHSGLGGEDFSDLEITPPAPTTSPQMPPQR